jgi:hypothetical protein
MLPLKHTTGSHSEVGFLSCVMRQVSELHQLLTPADVAVVLDAGARSSAFMLDGRSRTASGLVRDVHYEHDAHSAVFLHPEGASIFTEAESARVFEKLHSASARSHPPVPPLHHF